MNSKNRTVFTNVGISFFTSRAVPTGKMAFNGYIISDFMGVYVFS